MIAMEPVHISEADAVRDLAALLQRVQAGAEVVIERDEQPFAVIRAAAPPRRTISECIALMPAASTATIDPDFAKDVEAAVDAHREALEPRSEAPRSIDPASPGWPHSR
jgi:antitoxin (DNA-binding transcriptional repressor) of toxin-antitoxin stability system